MVDKRITELADALVASIDSIDKAKQYTYDGKQLEDAEKAIFNDTKLKNDDGTPKLPEVKNTVVLLDNLKKAQSKLADEQKEDANLTKNGNDFLIVFLDEKRKGNDGSIAYQLINTDEGGKKRVDKIIKDYQSIQFRRINKELELKKRASIASLNSIRNKGEKKDKEIEKAQKKRDENKVEDVENLKNKIAPIIALLQADLAVGQPGYKILNEVVKIQKNITNTIYRVNTEVTDPTLGSIIKTGVESPYPAYVHPTFLGEGFPWQMRKLFEQFDQKKLFGLIETNFSGDAGKINKIKNAFKRVLNAKVELKFNNEPLPSPDSDENGYMGSFYANEDPNNPPHGESDIVIPRDLDDLRDYVLSVSDVFYFMNALFPQKDVNTVYSDSPFLKAGNSALPFADSKNTLATEHAIYWRARQDNTPVDVATSGNNYRSLGGRNPRVKAFPSTKLELSWAGSKGKSIPEFFWKVYNDPKATQFTFRRGSDKKGNDVPLWDGEISVYENQLITWKDGTTSDPWAMAYRDRFKAMIDLNVKGTDRIGALTDDQRVDLNVYWSDFEEVLYDIVGQAHETFHNFRKDAEATSYVTLKNSGLKIPYMIENTKADLTDVDKFWDKMVGICDAKIDAAKIIRAELGTALNERNKINSEENSERAKLTQINADIDLLAKGKIDNLGAQLDHLGEKLADPSVRNAITHREALSIRSLRWLLKKLEEASGTPPNVTLNTKYDGYITKLEEWEINRGGDLRSYSSWKKIGSSFDERLKRWKESDGRLLDEEAITAYFRLVEEDLKKLDLSPEEKAELTAIQNYLSKGPELRKGELENVFNLNVGISQKLVDEWKNYGDKKIFKESSKEIKKIVDMFNKLSTTEKGTFFTELKTYLTGKSGVPNFPDDFADEWDKSDYYFTLKPEYVIGAMSNYKIKNETAEKDKIKAEMEAAKDSDGIPLSKDSKTGYGDGKDFTDEGIIKYHSEKTGGINHNYSKQKDRDDGEKSKSWWSWENPMAIITGVCLGATTVIIIAGIVYWEKIAAWWDGPANAEGNGDSDEENDE